MFGVVTRNESEVTWPEFDLACYEMKDVTGRRADPVDGAVNMISCFGDNRAAEANPDLVPVSETGERATRDRPYFDWDYVCPSHDDYRTAILELVDAAAAACPDVRLDDVGFPRGEYCHCDRCDERFANSQYADREAWRAATITEFVATAREHVPGELHLTLYPDPYPGHLYKRSGIDPAGLAAHVDSFVVPLYDTAYGTTYWLESIASGFADRLDAPLAIELYAIQVDVDALVRAARVAHAYAATVLFAYDASNARAAVRRIQDKNDDAPAANR